MSLGQTLPVPIACHLGAELHPAAAARPPALCAVLLQPHHGPRRGIIGLIMRSIDRVRDAYGAVVARIVRFSVIGLAMVVVAGFGVVGLAKITPTGFLPEDDQGALFVVVQLPGG